MRASVTLGLALALAMTANGAAGPGPLELPTEWSLSAPPDVVTHTGTLPQGAALTADGNHLVVVEDGQAGAAVRILDAKSLALERSIAMSGATADPLPDPNGSGVWASGAGHDTLVHLDAATGTVDRTIALPKGSWASAIARSPDGKTLAVSCELANAVVFVDLAVGTAGAPIAVGHHPYGITFSADGKTVYVANWAQSSLSAIDVAGQRVRATIAVGKHPDHVLLAADGRHLFVSESDDDAIGVVDLASDARVAGANAAPYGGKLFGASPSALALSADGKRLYVTDSAANAVAVLDVAGETPHLIGAIPAGWYPTAVVVERNETALDVVDGKGESSRANPHFKPFERSAHERGYVASEEIGSVRRVPIPNDAALAAGLDTVRANAGPWLDATLSVSGPPSRPDYHSDIVPPRPDTVVRYGGPLRHVIYVVKENRTYDQVLGDLPGAAGDPSLALFDAKVTPNEHAIAQRFGVLDNTFADAEVSADGHNWSMAAFANDYLERNWPPNYGGRRELYDFEDEAEGSTPHAGYLWNAALAAGRTVRNYGEFTTENRLTPKPDIVSHMAGLAGVTDPLFPGFDLAYSDLDREAEWAREFAAYVRDDNLPQLEIVRLPNDHTSGTRVGKLTPSAYVAQNDIAVGRLVDVVSHSRYWRDTAIFVVEDDAQNGPDHIDDQRMTAYVASAYAAGGVIHEHYSTAGIVRSIEMILGLDPLSAYDAAARPLYDAFVWEPDMRPFDALPAKIDLDARNLASAYGARQSAAADFTREDRVPDALLNDVVWHAVRGARATPPPYGAF
jgi:YVTN family beta-propeller protein